MGFLKGCAKLVGSAVLGVTGVASTVLESMFDTVGVELGSEIFGAAKDASFNGIRNMWDMETQEPDGFETKEDRLNADICKLKAKALRCKDMAQKSTNQEAHDGFMRRYDELMEEARILEEQKNTIDDEDFL